MWPKPATSANPPAIGTGQRIEGGAGEGLCQRGSDRSADNGEYKQNVPIRSAANDRVTSTPILCPCRPETTRMRFSPVGGRFDVVSVRIAYFPIVASMGSADPIALSIANPRRRPKRPHVPKRTASSLHLLHTPTPVVDRSTTGVGTPALLTLPNRPCSSTKDGAPPVTTG